MSDKGNIPVLKCMCCLATKVPFINLNTCKHAGFFSTIFENKMDFAGMFVCISCHCIISKINNFKHQVEECYFALKKVSKVLKNKTRKLQISTIDVYSTVNNQSIEYVTKEFVVSKSDLKTELSDVKEEDDSCSETEMDQPLMKIKRTRKKRLKAEVKKVNKTSVRLGPRVYDGKIKIVMISQDEMLEERRTDLLKSSYINLPYKCESCITGFDHKLTLNLHMEQRHSTKSGGYVCDICKSVLSTETSFKAHQQRHLRRYECVECGKRNNNVYSVVKHYKEEHGPINFLYSCSECEFTTESQRSLRYHRDKHKAKVQCSDCNKTFVNSTVLRVHKFTVHRQSDRVYSCNVCGKRYHAKSSLVAHVSRHNSAHTGDTFCATCGTQFGSALGLKHHLKTHSKHIRDSDKRFTCDDCGLRFLTKGPLQEHIDWVHLKKAKFECDKCPKVFKNNSGLQKHINYVHEKKRPPRNKICDHCGRGFTTLSILRAHVRTHTGERPLRCAHCPAAFAHPAARYTHTKLLHANNK
ncbi:zinc finger protein OZF-like [Battus philenor]|uniref:zinc finger protein OZF-like n=1 Tax=Battus philenor TaxID=42288 RepID=UPI0035D0FCAB